MLAPPRLDSLEQARRLSGLKFTTLSQRTGISYKRLWRFFREDGSLSRLEYARLQEALADEATAPASTGEDGAGIEGGAARGTATGIGTSEGQ